MTLVQALMFWRQKAKARVEEQNYIKLKSFRAKKQMGEEMTYRMQELSLNCV